MKIGNALSRVVQSIYAIALTDRVSSHVVMRKLLSGAEKQVLCLSRVVESIVINQPSGLSTCRALRLFRPSHSIHTRATKGEDPRNA